jgi:hypothetical protein
MKNYLRGAFLWVLIVTFRRAAAGTPGSGIGIGKADAYGSRSNRAAIPCSEHDVLVIASCRDANLVHKGLVGENLSRE